jgi:hypothetical protein
VTSRAATAQRLRDLAQRRLAPQTRQTATVAATATTKENRTYCLKLVRSRQAMPTETAKVAPAQQMETR